MESSGSIRSDIDCEREKKRKRRRKDSRGEQKLKEANQKEKRSSSEHATSSKKYIKDKKFNKDVALDPTRVGDDQLEKLFNGLKQCCKKRSEKGCFLEIFKICAGQYDKTAAYAYCREIREKTREYATPEARELLIQNLIRSVSILDQRTNKWKHNFCFMHKSKAHNVCIKTFAEIHGFTKYAFEESSKKLKFKNTSDPYKTIDGTTIIRPLCDSYVHDMSYNDAVDLLDANLTAGSIGE
jgi:hypothetical protein